MAAPVARVNTFTETDKKGAYIDNISKLFIFCELPFGINRLYLLRNIKNIYLVISILYSFVFLAFVSYQLTEFLYDNYLNVLVRITNFIQIYSLVLFSFLSRKKLKCYYNTLTSFDSAVGFKPKPDIGDIWNTVYTVLEILYTLLLCGLHLFLPHLVLFYPRLLPSLLTLIMELHYSGHLLSLLVPRLKVINHYMRLALHSTNMELVQPRICIENKALCKMEKLMSLYHIIVEADGFLIDAVKWQLLFILMTSFINILIGCYNTAFGMIHGHYGVINLSAFLGLCATVFAPLFSPCILCDKVQSEVLELRELLTARLYKNKLDKCSREVARALLAWTETRDLSFSLMRMLDVNVSLPFKFAGLLITHLIILLQFQKVINL